MIRDDHATPLDREPLDLVAFEQALAERLTWQEPAIDSARRLPRDAACTPVQIVPLLSTNFTPVKRGVRGAARRAEAVPPNAAEVVPDTVEALLAATKAAFPRPVVTAGPTSAPAPASASSHAVLHVSFYSSTTSRALACFEARSDASLSDLFAALPCTSEAALLRIGDTRYTTASDGSLATYTADAAPGCVHRFTHSTSPLLRALRPRVGMPYVFVHDGDCEHRLIFTDAFAKCGAAEGVRCTWRAPPEVLACDVCRLREAAMSVFGDRLAAVSPVRYCNTCQAQRHLGTHHDDTVLSRDYATSAVAHQPLLDKDV